MKFLVHVPVYKRYATLKLFDNTIKELQKNYEIEVVAVGSCEGDRNVCENFGYHYINHPNRPLGGKFQSGLNYAKNFEFDALILLGSDDILSANVLDMYRYSIEQGYEFIGFTDAYFFDLERKNMRYWKGYKGDREGEPIGAWRCFSRSALDKVGWNLWNNENNSPDYQMWQKIGKLKKRTVKCGDNYRVVDLKSNDNITSFHKFPNSQPINAKQVMKGHFTPFEINEIMTY